jgi:hypothetical protein
MIRLRRLNCVYKTHLIFKTKQIKYLIIKMKIQMGIQVTGILRQNLKSLPKMTMD